MTATQSTASHGFELLREQNLAEINSTARFYRHGRTGAELLSLINSDENKVFGVSFATPPSDSTGVAHILEHSVLCGSRKYQVKEPFVEDRNIAAVPKMTLATAVAKLRKAGHKGEFGGVTLRWPLGPGFKEPLYIFGIASDQFWAVGTKTGKVTPIS